MSVQHIKEVVNTNAKILKEVILVLVQVDSHFTLILLAKVICGYGTQSLLIIQLITYMQISMNVVLIMVDAFKTVTIHLEVSIVHVTLDTV